MASFARLSNCISKTTAKLELLRLTFAFEKVQRKRETFCHAYFSHTQTEAQPIRMREKPDVVNHNESLTLTGVFSIFFGKHNQESRVQKQS